MNPRTAFITGASSGIGRALAVRLAQDGATIGLAARRADLLGEVAQQIQRSGGRAHVFELDVRRPQEVRDTLRRADDLLEGLDLVVANAGVAKNRRAQAFRWDECEDMLAVNVTGAVATLTALLDRMVERKRGHLLGVTSLAGVRALPGMAAYSASKAFLSRFLEGLRVDLSGTGLHVTEARPGFVESPMTDRYRTTGQPMPFMVSAAEAAERIASAIDAEASLVAFPWPLNALVRTASLVPEPVWRAGMRRLGATRQPS